MLQYQYGYQSLCVRVPLQHFNQKNGVNNKQSIKDDGEFDANLYRLYQFFFGIKFSTKTMPKKRLKVKVINIKRNDEHNFKGTKEITGLGLWLSYQWWATKAKAIENNAVICNSRELVRFIKDTGIKNSGVDGAISENEQ